MIIGNTMNCPADSSAEKKLPSDILGQVDFLIGQVTLHSLPKKKRYQASGLPMKSLKDQTKLGWGSKI